MYFYNETDHRWQLLEIEKAFLNTWNAWIYKISGFKANTVNQNTKLNVFCVKINHSNVILSMRISMR